MCIVRAQYVESEGLKMKANDFILNCIMRPIRRHGVNTDAFIVYTDKQSPIGTYDPADVEFKPVDNWPITFSKELIQSVFEGSDSNA
jgi:hypothetical protein